jgi:hypothetical protein
MGLVARCPTHNDRNPSLSLTIDPDGKLLAYCHAGCSFEAIIGELKNRKLLETIHQKSFYSFTAKPSSKPSSFLAKSRITLALSS